MTNQDLDLSAWFAAIVAAHDERSDAIQDAYQQLRDTGLLSRVTVHRYMCQRGCQIATVFRTGGSTLCAVRDYKYSPGLNKSQSVESARMKNTLDGDRHWPAHVYDVDELAEWGENTGMSVACRHYRGVLNGARVLADSRDAKPGHPGKPTRLVDVPRS